VSVSVVISTVLFIVYPLAVSDRTYAGNVSHLALKNPSRAFHLTSSWDNDNIIGEAEKRINTDLDNLPVLPVIPCHRGDASETGVCIVSGVIVSSPEH
jgi:hypothetical protein